MLYFIKRSEGGRFVYNLIIVDDEPEILAGLCTIVKWQDLGFSLKAAFPDGESALKWLEGNDADVLLTDVVMGGTSGLDLALWMQRNRPQSRVVLVSAYDEFDYARRAIEAKVFRYLLKPTRISELTAAFRDLKAELDAERPESTPPRGGGAIHRAKNFPLCGGKPDAHSHLGRRERGVPL